MDWTKVVVCPILMPPNQQAPIRFDPATPVVFVRHLRFESKPDLDARVVGRIGVDTEKPPRCHLADDAVRPRLVGLGASPPHHLAGTAKPIHNPVVEPPGL
jgi:hypothetical protein